MDNIGYCGMCGFEIHPHDSVRHFGRFDAHQEARCIEILKDQIRLNSQAESGDGFNEGVEAAARIAEGYPPVAGQLYGQDIAIAIRALRPTATPAGEGAK